MNTISDRLAVIEQKLDQLLSKKKIHLNDGKPLKEWIVELFKNSNEPLTAKEVADLLLDAGYKTLSKKFAHVVLNTLASYPEFRKATKKRKPFRFTLA